MPHGGGHIGGGHHGGGGFGGGHHHSHHHHHNYGGSGGVYVVGGGWGWGYRRRGRPIHGLIWGGVGVFICVVVVLSVTLSIRFGNQKDEEKNYSPGDSRIHTFSTFFCSSVKVSAPSLPSSENGKVYYLKEIPPLSDRNQVNISQAQFTLDEGAYAYWHFYLYPNSNLTYSGCVTPSSLPLDFYLIKGTSKFNSWKDSPSTSKSIAYTHVSRSCDVVGKVNNQLSYTIHSEDHYYLVYYNNQYYTISGQQSIVIDRFEYASPPNDTTINDCDLSSFSPCSILSSFQSPHHKVLIKMPEPSGVDFDSTTYRVDISCGAQAIGYIIVVVVPFTALTICLSCLVILFCYLHKKKKNSYRPAINRNQASDADALIKEVPPAYTENPPPYNPSY